MEKFSAFRDPGTGIQPFLNPVPLGGGDILAYALLPFGYAVGAIRITALVLVGMLYVVLVNVVCLPFTAVPPIYRTLSRTLTAVLSRLALFLIGIWWISVEVVTRKRGRGKTATEAWNPGPGDLIVSNWASFVEVLWLAFRFNPIFVLPVVDRLDLPSKRAQTPALLTPGRRTGTGSAAITPTRTRGTMRSLVRGFRRVSLFQLLHATGHTPVGVDLDSKSQIADVRSLEEIRASADRPVVVFPECTTSNGRALLRFATLFRGVEVPVKDFEVFIMAVRYDPPTALAPTLTHSVPSTRYNPFPHIFFLTTCLMPQSVSIRLLTPSESPSSATFVHNEGWTDDTTNDRLTEACAVLIAGIGRMKRIGFGWEAKAEFLDFYERQARR